jgi:PAS domain S-box-containing protein
MMNLFLDLTSYYPTVFNLVAFWQPAILTDVFLVFHLAGHILFGSALVAIAFLFLYHRNNRHLKIHGIILYLAAFTLACGASFFLEALTIWFPMNWLPPVFLCISGLLGWATVVYFIRVLPELLAKKSVEDLKSEVALRKDEEDKFRNLPRFTPAKDVPEKVTAETLLMESESRYRSLIEQASDAIILVDAQFRFFDINPAGLELIGYQKEEFRQLTIYDVFFKEDLEKEPLQIGELLVNKYLNTPRRIKRKDGSGFDAEVSTKVLDTGEMLVIVRDNTERKAAEEKLVRSEKLYRSLFTNMLDGFAYCKAILKNNKLVDFTFLAVNEEYQKLTSQENLSGKNCSEVMPGLLKSNSDLVMHMRDAAVYGKTAKFEQHIPRLDRWFSISIYSPEKGYFVSLIDNITERKKAEAEIKALNEGLELRVKERTEELESFSYSVSHDLRAPLRAVKGYAKILEEDYSPSFDKEGKRLLGEVQNHAQNMGMLIEELLAFSRLGRKDVSKDRINMEMMIRDIIKEISITTEIKAKIEFGELLPVMADQFLLKHVMMNLLSNALKFSSQEEQPLVKINSHKENGMIIYSIEDNGVGFEMNYQHKLFNLFQRLHTVEEFPGTGVGLSIVQRIIHKHNGKVWGVGKISEGATFFFSLPDTEL